METQLCGKMASVDIDVLKKCGDTRHLHCQQLRNLSEEIDLLFQKFNNDKIKGNGASLIGGALTTISGLATIVTGGLALPVLGVIGTMIGVSGGLWNYMGSIKKNKEEQKILKTLETILNEDRLLQEQVRHEITKYNILGNTERDAVGEQILIILKGWCPVYQCLGPEVAFMELTGALPPVAVFFTGIPAVMTFLGAAGTGLSQYFAEGAKEMADEAIWNAVEKAGKTLPNNWTKRYIIENAYGEIIKRNGGTIAKEGAEVVADDVAVAEEIAKQAKSISQWVGGITAGLGAIFCIWDAYQIHEAWGPSKKGYKTLLGEALRRIATEIEPSISMNNKKTLAEDDEGFEDQEQDEHCEENKNK